MVHLYMFLTFVTTLWTYHGSKTYVFGDLLVRLVDSWGTPYYRVSLKPPIFDLEDFDPNHLDMDTFLSLLEE